MIFKRHLGVFLALFLALLSNIVNIIGYMPSWNLADPVPLFSTMYPYWFFSLRQKDEIRAFTYVHPLDRWSISITPFFQKADRGRDENENVDYLGDIPNGRWNMLGLFWDPPLRNKLFRELSITTTLDNCQADPDLTVAGQCNPPSAASGNPNCECDIVINSKPCSCFHAITNPRKRDLNREFGYFTIPLRYRKGGIRLEGGFLLLDRCFYSLGLWLRTGVANVKQHVVAFQDLTCQALGTACPAFCPPENGPVTIDSTTTGCPNPAVVAPPGVTPPFVSPANIPPCSTICEGINAANVLVPKECLPLVQKFIPCCNQTCCFSFDCNCKRLVIEKIMKQKHLIGDILKRNFCNYDHTGFEDLRVELFYKHIFVMNDYNPAYPRFIFMPFATLGVILPLDKQIPNNMPFAVPLGSNGHFGVGGSAGFTLDFLSTIDFGFQVGFTHFFERDYCNFPLRTHVAESGIFPYFADIKLEPGRTSFYRVTIHGYHFLELFSTWFEFIGVNHNDDNIKVCHSYIPPDSCYFNQGFLVKDVECHSSWSAKFLRIGFNYDLSPHMLAGVAFSIPLDQRNAYNSGTILGSLTFVY